MGEEQAMAKCPKCKETIPKATKICPACGLNIRRRTIVNAVVILSGITVLLAMFLKGIEERKVQEHAECKESAKCLGDKKQRLFVNYCGFAIGKRAKYAYRWTNDELQPQFADFKWHDQPNEIITAFGNKIQFQTKAGTWQNMSYECDLDIANSKVVGVRIK